MMQAERDKMVLLNNWIFWAILTSIAYLFYNIIFKIGSGENIYLFLITAHIAAFFLYFLFLFFISNKSFQMISLLNGKTIVLGTFAGIAMAFFEIGFILMLQNNPSGLTVGNALIGILTLLLTVLAGIFLFKEQVTLQNGFGILFAIIAVALLSYPKP